MVSLSTQPGTEMPCAVPVKLMVLRAGVQLEGISVLSEVRVVAVERSRARFWVIQQAVSEPSRVIFSLVIQYSLLSLLSFSLYCWSRVEFWQIVGVISCM